jgi:Flp pilus assembly protein TadG
MMIRQISNSLLRIIRDPRGVAAVEFAIILPLMLVMFMGSVEVTNLLTADRRTTTVASTLADLVARDDTITTTEMNDIFEAGAAIMEGMPSAAMKMRVTSIIETNGQAKVGWSRAKNDAPLTKGSTISGLPAGLLQTNGSVIRAEVTLPYELTTVNGGSYKLTGTQPAVSYDLQKAHTITKTFYLRPRLVMQIPEPS